MLKIEDKIKLADKAGYDSGFNQTGYDLPQHDDERIADAYMAGRRRGIADFILNKGKQS